MTMPLGGLSQLPMRPDYTPRLSRRRFSLGKDGHVQVAGIVRGQRLEWVRLRTFSLVLLVWLALVTPANAQTAVDVPDARFGPTRGVFVPDGARSGQADATA